MRDVRAELLGIISFVIAVFAYLQSRKTDQVIRALANLEYDEKLSMMAIHLNRLRQEPSLVAAESAKHDLRAVSNLRNYASEERKDCLIKEYVIPMIRECLAKGSSGGVAITVNEIIDVALNYGIARDQLEELKRQARSR